MLGPLLRFFNAIVFADSIPPVSILHSSVVRKLIPMNTVTPSIMNNVLGCEGTKGLLVLKARM